MQVHFNLAFLIPQGQREAVYAAILRPCPGRELLEWIGTWFETVKLSARKKSADEAGELTLVGPTSMTVPMPNPANPSKVRLGER